MIDLLVSPHKLVLEMDQLPQVMRVHILDAAGTNLDLSDRVENLVPEDFNFSRVLLCRTLSIDNKTSCCQNVFALGFVNTYLNANY